MKEYIDDMMNWRAISDEVFLQGKCEYWKGIVISNYYPGFRLEYPGNIPSTEFIKIFVLEKDYELAKKLITENVNSPMPPDQEDWVLPRIDLLENRAQYSPFHPSSFSA